MSQTVPPPDPNAPRPLPRRPAPRPPAGRPNRPRFAPLDAAWAILLATLSLALSAHLNSFAGGRSAGAFAQEQPPPCTCLAGARATGRRA